MARTRGRGLARTGATALAAIAIMTASYGAWEPTAAVAAPAAPAATAATAYTPPARNLAPGMRGADVKAFQERLSALKYYPGAINGYFSGDSEAALWAFQEINGITPTGVVGAATKRALARPRAYRSPYYAHKRATRVEVSQALEVLVLFRDNQIVLISHVSSGGGYYYDCGEKGCARAVTPNGLYYTTAYLSGWVRVPLGEMYNPVFFIGHTYAIHGDTDVPAGPASHGCVRVPMDVASFFHTLVATPGTQVYIYGVPQWER